MSNEEPIIHLAPLQGFTDHIYRRCFHKMWNSVDQFYIPYLSIGHGQKIRNSQMRDVEQGNNQQLPAIPQVLVANSDELRKLVAVVLQNGFDQLNLNLGCPYPMATNKGRGAGLLENADQLTNVMEVLFGEYNLKVSVKLRSGLSNSETCMERLGLINRFPFEKVIFHARTADQMYKGKADVSVFGRFKAGCDHPVVYNGDLFSLTSVLMFKNYVH